MDQKKILFQLAAPRELLADGSGVCPLPAGRAALAGAAALYGAGNQMGVRKRPTKDTDWLRFVGSIMSWKIQIYRAKPNPAGKDTSHGRPLAAQLLGEWVDLKNVGDGPAAISILYLSNTEFGPGCVVTQAAKNYWNGPSNGSIKPGEIARVHTGRSGDAWQMQAVDKEGVTHHFYAESGLFVLNNDCGDNLGLTWKTSEGKWLTDDAASYRPRPAEGKILQRIGSELV